MYKMYKKYTSTYIKKIILKGSRKNIHFIHQHFYKGGYVMANIENLQPVRSKEEARKRRQRRSEKNLGASRRKKKYIKEQLETLMLLDLTDTTLTNNMRRLGIEESDLTIQNRYFVCISYTSIASEI